MKQFEWTAPFWVVVDYGRNASDADTAVGIFLIAAATMLAMAAIALIFESINGYGLRPAVALPLTALLLCVIPWTHYAAVVVTIYALACAVRWWLRDVRAAASEVLSSRRVRLLTNASNRSLSLTRNGGAR